MTRADRAKQFLPFDALKGLREELEAREEKMSRVPKRILTDEMTEELSQNLAKIRKESVVLMTFYRNGHYYELEGKVESMNVVFKYIQIGEERIFFDDIFSLTIVNV